MARFKIRRLDEPEKKPPPVPPPKDEVAEEQAPEPVKPVDAVDTGARFASAAQLLSYLGAIAGLGLAPEADCRRDPLGRFWWGETQGICERSVELARAAGGTPYLGRADRWAPVPAGKRATELALNGHVLDLSGWQRVDLRQLVPGLPLRPCRYVPRRECLVITTGSLARWILRRAAGVGIETSLQTITMTPLNDEAQPTTGLLLHLRSGADTLPASLIDRLIELPYTVVAAGGGHGNEQLLVDIRYRPPLETHLLADLLPPGETWLFAGPDCGHHRLALGKKTLPGADLLAPLEALAPRITRPNGNRLPKPLPVRLVVQTTPYQVDAVLIDDKERTWLRPFLMSSSLGERGFLLPGEGVSLLLAPGGLSTTLPFGVPLVHLSPGPLYLEAGLGFYPPLPEAARIERYQLDGKAAVAVTARGAWSFPASRLIPCWRLWQEKPAETRNGLSNGGRELLQAVAWEINRMEAQQLRERATEQHPGLIQPKDRQALRKRALKAQQEGNFVVAAQLLEKLGEHAEAARLYEKAAATHRGKAHDS
ncbi:MAG: hypothetical protein QNK37_33885 [Acidobacteriota bacterium]|nr:hypothetical protein [Acidobacteriota bacterium]